MSKHRIDKVNKELKQLISSYIAKNLANQFSAIISVNIVIVSKDLRAVKVFVSFLNKELNIDIKKEKNYLNLLQKKAVDIQAYISSRIRMKFNPKLKFFLDDTINAQACVQNLLDSL